MMAGKGLPDIAAKRKQQLRLCRIQPGDDSDHRGNSYNGGTTDDVGRLSVNNVEAEADRVVIGGVERARGCLFGE